MNDELEQRLREEIAYVKERLLRVESDYSESLNYSEMAIVDTNAEMKIINSDGAIDTIFADCINQFERGASLLVIVYKTTNNTKPSIDNVYKNSDDIDSIEETVLKFIEGTLEEKTIRVVGEKESGELFLLVWRIRRKELKRFRSFFKVIPTNAIIQASQDKHKTELNSFKKTLYDTLSLIEEGAIILNLKSEIQYMNSSAKIFFFGDQVSRFRNAPIEGRYFQEILVNEPTDDVRLRLESLAECSQNVRPVSYSLKKNEKSYLFKIFPMMNEKKVMTGTITIIKDDIQIFSNNANSKQEIEKMSRALKHYSTIAKKSETRIAELEHNQKWLMNQSNEYQSALRSVYAFLDNLPAAVLIISLPSRKYEFANIAFLRKFKLSKEQVKGKTDDDVLPWEDAEIFATKNQEAIETSEAVKVSTPNYYAKQIVLVNANNKPINLLRLFS